MSSSEAVFQQFQYFRKYPALEVTPIAVVAKDSTIEGECTVNPKKILTSKEEQEIRKLEKQLPILSHNFELLRKVGEGTYSSVYLATSRERQTGLPKKLFAIKHLVSNFNLQRIDKELKFMQAIGGQDNVISAYSCLRSANEDCAVFIMPYLEHKRFSEYVLDFDADELRLYMKNLFIALRRVHSFNVIHRDVKPGNFLYNRETKEFLLVDFGLAQMVDDHRKTKSPVEKIEGENVPLDYSKKRKRPNTDEDLQTPVAKKSALSPFKSIENISLERTPLKCKMTPGLNNNSTSSSSSSSRKKLFEDSTNSPLQRKGSSLATCLLKTQTELKLANTPRGVSVRRSFTQLNPSNTFVQVRNSQVVQGRSGEIPMQKSSCLCTGDGSICVRCQGKRAMVAPRAGTPGFRPPEVLLKCLQQTTAVDMWAAGVIMLCILSGCYPFFRSPNDLAGLAEMMTLFGTQPIIDLAAKFSRRVCISIKTKGMNLQKLCRRLRCRKTVAKNDEKTTRKRCDDCGQPIFDDGCICLNDKTPSSANDAFPPSAYQLLSRLLDLDPTTRITAAEALEHPFILNSK